MSNQKNYLNQTYKNILNGSFAIFVVAVSSVISTPIILNNLGKELYGLWLVIFNFLAYFYLSDFGITNAIIRVFAKFKVTREKDLYKLISTAYILIFFLSFILLILLVSLRDTVFIFLEINDELFNIFSFIYFVGVFEIISQFMLRINIGVLKGKHRYDLAYNLEGIAAISRLVAILLLSFIGLFDIYYFTLAYAAIKILTDGLSIFFLKEEIKSIRLIFDQNIFKELFDIGSSSFLISFFNLVINSLPILLFGKYFGLINIVLFSIPLAVMRIVTRLINTIYNGVNPQASELSALKDEAQIYKISSFGVKLALLISVPIFGMFAFFGRDLLHLWLGGSELNLNDFNTMNNILLMLFIYIFFETMYKVNIFIYRSAGYHWNVTLEIIISAMILHIFSFLFLDLLSMYVFCFSFIVIGIFKYFYYKYLSTKTIRTFSIPYLTLLITLFYCFLAYLINYHITIQLHKIILLTLWLSIYVFISYTFIFNKNERHTILNQIKKIYTKFF